MGLRPTQGDEKPLLSSNRSPWKASPSRLSSRAYPDFLLRGTKDDLVCGFHQGKPHELCGTHRTQQEIRGSRGICSSADLSWKCFSTERSAVDLRFPSPRKQREGWDPQRPIYPRKICPTELSWQRQAFPRAGHSWLGASSPAAEREPCRFDPGSEQQYRSVNPIANRRGSAAQGQDR